MALTILYVGLHYLAVVTWKRHHARSIAPISLATFFGCHLALQGADLVVSGFPNGAHFHRGFAQGGNGRGADAASGLERPLWLDATGVLSL